MTNYAQIQVHEEEEEVDDIVVYDQPEYDQPETPLLPHAEPAVLLTTPATDEPATSSSSSSSPSTPPRIGRQVPPTRDGVFANLSAKPTASVGDDFKEEDGPPPYETAAADATPPYFDMTVITAGTLDDEILVDGLPVGSGFSFVWNMLVSMSFQFVGFLFTYLLHTSHASKYGSRAGLGITLIQYGFYLRSHGTDQDQYYGNGGQSTETEDVSSRTELLVYIVMALGWFIFLRSTAEYIRAKKMQAVIAYHPETGAV